MSRYTGRRISTRSVSTCSTVFTSLLIIGGIAVGYNYGRLHGISSECSNDRDQHILSRSSLEISQSEAQSLMETESKAHIAELTAQLEQLQVEKEHLTAKVEDLKATSTSKPCELFDGETATPGDSREEKGDDTPDSIAEADADQDKQLSSNVAGTTWQSILAVDARRIPQVALKGYPAQRTKSHKGVLLTRGSGGSKQCNKLSLLVVNEKQKDECVMILEQQFDQYDLLTFSASEESRRKPFVATTWEAEATAGYLPKERQQKESLKKLTTFLQHRENMLGQLNYFVKNAKNAKKHKNTIIVMCLNAGMIDLALNFVCSCRKSDIDISNLIVFASDKATHETLTEFGLQSFWHEGFGKLPSNAAAGYGDMTFVAMMWLKVFSFFVICSKFHGYPLMSTIVFSFFIA